MDAALLTYYILGAILYVMIVTFGILSAVWLMSEKSAGGGARSVAMLFAIIGIIFPVFSIVPIVMYLSYKSS